MSITMITTSMLNSMGFEKQTFLFFFISAATTLLCILLLPKFCGGYAYVIGLGASYVVGAVCNLLLLWKNQLIFQKARGQVWDKGYFIPLVAVLPLSLVGQLIRSLCGRIFGESVCVLVCAICLIALTLLLYAFTGILPVKKLLKKENLPRGEKRAN